MSLQLTLVSSSRCFGGLLKRYRHASKVFNLPEPTQSFHVYVPDQATSGKVPALYYLGGLFSTDEDIAKQGSEAFRYASELGMAMIVPDTSPKGHQPIEADPSKNILSDQGHWDFGHNASWYLDATREPFTKNYNMYSYVTKELPSILTDPNNAQHFSWYNQSNISITGHSMGGHGALTMALKNPDMYRSVSAFAPVSNLSIVRFGIQALEQFTNNPAEEGKMYDATLLMEAGYKHKNPILIDIGGADEVHRFMLPENFKAACDKAGQKCTLDVQPGYDHGYNFVTTFFEKHLRYHRQFLD